MKSLRDTEAVGWLFFLVLFVLFTPLCAFFSWQLTHDSISPALRVGMGIFCGGILAGVVSTLVNEVLHRRNVRRFKAKKKEEKKKKRKKK
jgi:uncharacterized protein (DUF2062 family)